MAKQGSTLYAILGVLTKGSSSGYEIRKYFSGSLRYFWSESYGQIYPALKELVQSGYALEESIPGHARGQKKYRITPAGTDHFQSWLARLPEPMNYRDELLLKVFFATSRDRQCIQALFEHEIGSLEAQLSTYLIQQQELQAHMPGSEYPLWRLTLSYGIISAEARLQWCREAVDLLTSLEEGGVSLE